MYTVQWVSEGSYVIKDTEYGEVLFRISFSNYLDTKLDKEKTEKVVEKIEQLSKSIQEIIRS